jgi:hypothetical protein
MAIINTPNKEFTGISASVTFINGTGKTDNPYLVEWFREHGYEIVEDEETADETAEKSKKPKK